MEISRFYNSLPNLKKDWIEDWDQGPITFVTIIDYYPRSSLLDEDGLPILDETDNTSNGSLQE